MYVLTLQWPRMSWDAMVNIWLKTWAHIIFKFQVKKFANDGGNDYSIKMFQLHNVNGFITIYL
jgi:hypothetical protein